MIGHFLSCLPHRTRIMMLGCYGLDFVKPATDKGHQTTWITDGSDSGLAFSGGADEIIHCRIGPDACMVKMIDGHWVRPITLPEIINQLPGPYGAVISNLEDRNRMVAQSETLKAMYPFVLAYPDDGNNEGVIADYKRRGYSYGIMDGWLVLWRVA